MSRSCSRPFLISAASGARGRRRVRCLRGRSERPPASGITAYGTRRSWCDLRSTAYLPMTLLMPRFTFGTNPEISSLVGAELYSKGYLVLVLNRAAKSEGLWNVEAGRKTRLSDMISATVTEELVRTAARFEATYEVGARAFRLRRVSTSRKKLRATLKRRHPCVRSSRRTTRNESSTHISRDACRPCRARSPLFKASSERVSRLAQPRSDTKAASWFQRVPAWARRSHGPSDTTNRSQRGAL